jgi:tyrosine-protein phosphatase SIW14
MNVVNRMRRLFILILGSAAFLAACFLAAPPAPPAQSTATAASLPVHRAAPAQHLALPGVPNAGKINDFLYRGAQPKPEGFAELKKLGITIVVNLRDEAGEIDSERARVVALGLQYKSIPLKGRGAPTDKDAAEFLTLLGSASDQKVFVHCKYGADRTGVMIAAYRISSQKWSVEDAIREMNEFRFHHLWHPAMETYVR